MFDKELLKLIGGNKKYVVYTVLLMVLGMLANIGITASVCWAVYFLIERYEPLVYIYPAITATVKICWGARSKRTCANALMTKS